MGVEVVRQKDDIGRMNTVFKFYLQAWTLFGVSLGVRPGDLVRQRALDAGGRRWRRLAWAVVGVLFVGAMLYPPFAARAKIRDRFSAEASPRGLDGMAYMDKAQYFDNGQDLQLADDKAAMLWMMQNVQGSPVILEAQIPEYRWGSRFSIYTGLPTVQGWNWHQRQQRSVVPERRGRAPRAAGAGDLQHDRPGAGAGSCSTTTASATSSSARWSGRTTRPRAWRSSTSWWSRAT